MQRYKYIANRALTDRIPSLLPPVTYHPPLLENPDDFVLDNQMIAQAIMFGFRIGEISCPTKYFEEASSISFRRSIKYGLGVVGTTFRFVAHKWGVWHSPIFGSSGRKVLHQYYTR